MRSRLYSLIALIIAPAAFAELGGFSIDGYIQSTLGQSDDLTADSQSDLDGFALDATLSREFTVPGNNRLDLNLGFQASNDDQALAFYDEELKLSVRGALEYDVAVTPDRLTLDLRDGAETTAVQTLKLQSFDDNTNSGEYVRNFANNLGRAGNSARLTSVYVVATDANTSYFLPPSLSQSISDRYYLGAYNSPVFSSNADTTDASGTVIDMDDTFDPYADGLLASVVQPETLRPFSVGATNDPTLQNATSSRDGALATIVGLTADYNGRFAYRVQAGQASDSLAQEFGLELNFADLAVMTAHSSQTPEIESHAFTVQFVPKDTGLLVNIGSSTRADQGRTLNQVALFSRRGPFTALLDRARTSGDDIAVSDTSIGNSLTGWTLGYELPATTTNFSSVKERLQNSQETQTLTLSITHFLSPNLRWVLLASQSKQISSDSLVTDPSATSAQFQLRYTF